MNTNNTSEIPLILLVEDSPTQALQVRFVLEAAGFKVAHSRNGIEVMEFVEDQHPDLILLDLNMPGMDGQEVAWRLKNDPTSAGIPIVFLTGTYREKKDIIKGLEIGGDDFLVKPIDDGILIARINATLRSTRIQRELGQLIQRLLTTINQVGEKLGGLLDIETLLETVVRLIYSNYGYPGVHIWLYENDQLRLKAAAGVHSDQLIQEQPYFSIIDQNYVVKCFHENILKRMNSLHPHYEKLFPGSAAMAAPLRSGGQVSGVLEIICDTRQIINTNELLVLGTLADLVSVALQNAYLTQILQEQATYDGLTGLLNRRAVIEYIESEWVRSSRYTHNLAICMVDLDRFKSVNDTFGHDTGDQALKAIGGFFQTFLRNNVDRAGRLGGDEFVLVLPETDLAGAQKVAQRCLNQLEHLELRNKKGDRIPITASIGVASWPECEAQDVTALMRIADESLYQAKADGRNRIHVATGSQTLQDPPSSAAKP